MVEMKIPKRTIDRIKDSLEKYQVVVVNLRQREMIKHLFVGLLIPFIGFAFVSG